MKAIEQWGIIYDVYQSIDWRRFKDIYFCKGKGIYKILLWILILLLLLCFINPWSKFIPIDGKWNPILSIVLSIVFFIFFICVERNTYKSYYSNDNNKYLLKQYRNDYLYIRYLIFKDYLKDRIEEIDFDKIKKFIDFELQKPSFYTLLKRNTLILILISILTYSISLITVSSDMKFLLTPKLILGISLLIFVLTVLLLFSGVFKDRKYKLYELKKFIFWLEQENNQN